MAKRMLHDEVPAGYTALPKNSARRLTGWKPSFITRPTPPPKGTVQTLPLLALQLAVMIGDDPMLNEGPAASPHPHENRRR